MRDHLEPRRRLRALQLLPRAVAGGQARAHAARTPSAPAALVRTYGDVQAALAAGPVVAAARRRAARRRRQRRCPTSARRRPDRDRRLAVPVPADGRSWRRYYLVALAIILGVRAARRGSARPGAPAPRSGGSARTSSSSAWPSCCSRRAAWSASACCSGRPGSSTPWPSSPSWPASCWRSSSTARFPIRHPSVFYVGLFVALGVAFLLPPEQLLIDPPLAALRHRRRPRLRAGLLREPRLQSTRSATRPRPTWPSPATCSGRWSAARWSTSPC